MCSTDREKYVKVLYERKRASSHPEINNIDDYRILGLFAVFVIGFWDQNAIFTQKLSDFGIISQKDLMRKIVIGRGIQFQ